MNNNIDTYKNLTIDELRQSLMPIINNFRKNYNFINISEEEFLKRLNSSLVKINKNINNSKNYNLNLIKNEIKYIFINYFNEQIQKEDISSINNYIKILKFDDYKDGIKSINQLEQFLKNNESEINPDIALKIIKDNNQMKTFLETFFKKYETFVTTNRTHKIVNNDFFLQFVEIYCSENNIEIDYDYIDETNDDDFDIKDKKSIDYFFKEIEDKKVLSREKERNLLARIKNNDNDATRIFVEHNLRLVVTIARRYLGAGMEFLDLIQEGSLGLLKAIDRFDLSYKTKFSTYASSWIRQAMKRAIDNKARAIRIPVHINNEIYSYNKAKRELIIELGRNPTIEEIADRLDVSIDDIKKLTTRIKDPLSLDESFKEDEELSLIDVTPDKTNKSVEEEALESDLKERVQNLFSKVTPTEEKVLRLRFGLEDGNIWTLQKIAKTMNVSRERVRQIEKKALTKLRNSTNSKKIKDYVVDSDEPLNIYNIIKQKVGNKYTYDQMEKAIFSLEPEKIEDIYILFNNDLEKDLNKIRKENYKKYPKIIEKKLYKEYIPQIINYLDEKFKNNNLNEKEIIVLHGLENGLTYAEIADEIGTDKTSVSYIKDNLISKKYIDDYSINRAKRDRVLREEDITETDEKILEELKTGLETEKIAKKLNVSASIVSRTARKMNIKNILTEEELKKLRNKKYYMDNKTKFDELLELFNKGLPISKIKKALKFTTATYTRHKKILKELELITEEKITKKRKERKQNEELRLITIAIDGLKNNQKTEEIKKQFNTDEFSKNEIENIFFIAKVYLYIQDGLDYEKIKNKLEINKNKIMDFETILIDKKLLNSRISEKIPDLFDESTEQKSDEKNLNESQTLEKVNKQKILNALLLGKSISEIASELGFSYSYVRKNTFLLIDDGLITEDKIEKAIIEKEKKEIIYIHNILKMSDSKKYNFSVSNKVLKLAYILKYIEDGLNDEDIAKKVNLTKSTINRNKSILIDYDLLPKENKTDELIENKADEQTKNKTDKSIENKTDEPIENKNNKVINNLFDEEKIENNTNNVSSTLNNIKYSSNTLPKNSKKQTILEELRLGKTDQEIVNNLTISHQKFTSYLNELIEEGFISEEEIYDAKLNRKKNEITKIYKTLKYNKNYKNDFNSFLPRNISLGKILVYLEDGLDDEDIAKKINTDKNMISFYKKELIELDLITDKIIQNSRKVKGNEIEILKNEIKKNKIIEVYNILKSGKPEEIDSRFDLKTINLATTLKYIEDGATYKVIANKLQLDECSISYYKKDLIYLGLIQYEDNEEEITNLNIETSPIFFIPKTTSKEKDEVDKRKKEVLKGFRAGITISELATKLKIGITAIERYKKEFISSGNITDEEIKNASIKRNKREVKKVYELLNEENIEKIDFSHFLPKNIILGKILKYLKDGLVMAEIKEIINLEISTISYYKKILINMKLITEEEIKAAKNKIEKDKIKENAYDDLEEYNDIINTFRTSEFLRYLKTKTPKEILITSLRVGLVDNKFYKVEDISAMVFMPFDEINSILNNIFIEYKNISLEKVNNSIKFAEKGSLTLLNTKEDN